MTRSTTVVIVMTAAAVALLAAPIAATGGSISADPAGADADSTHTVRAAVGPDLDDSSLSGLDVDYQATDRNGDVSNVDESDVETMYIDRADGGATDVTDDVNGVSASNNGETLNVRLGGSHVLHEGDHVVVSYSDATNPSAGEYEIVFVVNPQSDGTRSSGTLSIAEDGSSTTPTDDGATPAATDDGETPTETDDGPTPTPTFADESTPTRDDDERGGDGGNDDSDERRESGNDSDNGNADNGTATDRGADSSNGGDGGSGTDGNANDGDVARSNDADDGGDDGTESDGAGFGIALAAAALLGAALLVRR
jgi:PGF-CTERM protein